eukprot:CAMPEP_0176197530 /NCGR_PEP_ID=MMETSP0121_2-20121125/7589_1 /TAXON_ID=160619 /ORGANISM="Kryptoperidinium foliaceum, Strain CCMP 1326" /LENGTH=84 /DNA_ID=CAMNT_0017536361 /DNA_START=204 /DNA_END=453 /DNA_ORIENTATION=-
MNQGGKPSSSTTSPHSATFPVSHKQQERRQANLIGTSAAINVLLERVVAEVELFVGQAVPSCADGGVRGCTVLNNLQPGEGGAL